MIKPIKKDLDLHKGTTFTIDFRLKEDGSTVDVSLWQIDFVAVATISSAAIIAKSTADSPATITIDAGEDYLITITVPDTETAAIVQKGGLHFQIDATPPSGEVQRRWIGKLILIEAAEE